MNEVLVYASNALQICVLAILLVRCMRDTECVSSDRDEGARVLFAFALATSLAGELYWVAHLLLTQSPYLMFSVEDAASTGMFLLFAASLSTATPPRESSFAIAGLACATLIGAHIHLWIGWSGDVVRNIVSGIAFWRLVHVTVCGLSASHTLSRLQAGTMIALSVINTFLALLQYTVTDLQTSLFDSLLLVGLFTELLAFLSFALYVRFRKLSNPLGAASLAFASYVCARCTMYLSYEPFYTLADLCVTASLPLMFWGITHATKAVEHERTEGRQ